MPGSTVTTLPAARVLRDSWARRGSSWTRRPTPCPSPCPKASPKPAASILSRAAASTPGPGRPGRTAVEPRELGVETDLVCARQLVRELPGREGPRAVGAVAVDHAARVDDHRLARARRAGRRARCAAWPRSGPTRRVTGNETPSAFASCRNCSKRQASSRSVRPTSSPSSAKRSNAMFAIVRGPPDRRRARPRP